MKRIFNFRNFIVAAVMVTAIFFAKFPTLYHWLNTPKGYWFPKNTSWFDAWDINVYVSFLRYGQRYGMMLENTYTTITHPKVFIYQFYTFLGVLNRFFRLDPFIIFHLGTIVASIGLILAIYFAVRTFVADKARQLAVFILAVLGGGLGFIPLLQGADVWNAGFTTVNAFERGHDALSTAFLLLSLTSIYLFTETKKRQYLFWGILSTLASIAIHPPFILLYFSLSLVASLFHEKTREKIKSLIFPLSLIIMFVVYFWIFLSKLLGNPGFSDIGHATIGIVIRWMSSFSLLTGFGLLFIFIVWALFLPSEKDKKLDFVKLFFLGQLFFSYFPVDFNLYFIKGLYVWGAILAIYGMETLITNKRIANIALTLIVIASLFTRVYIFDSLMHASVKIPFFYLTQTEGDALKFMSQFPAGSSVLSLYRMGNYIPAHTDNRVYYGHKYMTPDAELTLKKAQIFYTAMTEEEQRKFLADNHIDYIYYGIEEAQLRRDNKLKVIDPFPYFPVLFSNDSSVIYGIGKL